MSDLFLGLLDCPHLSWESLSQGMSLWVSVEADPQLSQLLVGALKIHICSLEHSANFKDGYYYLLSLPGELGLEDG